MKARGLHSIYPETIFNAGLIRTRRCRATKRLVSVYDGIAAGMDTDAGRWQTVCEDHGTVISHQTRALALAHSRSPEWCEVCYPSVDP